MHSFKFTFPYAVRIADVNYGGHVANSAVLNYFQDARIAYFAHLGPYSELDIGEDCGIILPEAHVRYHREMFLRDQLVIGVRTVELQSAAFTLAYRIEREEELVAEGKTQLVAYDYSIRRPRRLPKAFKAAITQLENL